MVLSLKVRVSRRPITTILYTSECDLLDIAGALVNSANLTIAPEFLGEALAHEAHAAHPLDGEATNAARDLRREQLGHCGVPDEVLAGLLLAGRVVDERTGGRNLGIGLRDLVLHALELAYELPELLPVVPDVPNRYAWLERLRNKGGGEQEK